MNLFKKTIVVLIFVSQITPIVLADTAKVHRENLSKKNKVVSIALGAAAVVNAIMLGLKLSEDYREYNLLASTAAFQGRPVRKAFFKKLIPSYIIYSGLGISSGILAWHFYKKVPQKQPHKQ